MPDSVIVFIVVIVYLMIVIDIAIILYFICGSINKKRVSQENSKQKLGASSHVICQETTYRGFHLLILHSPMFVRSSVIYSLSTITLICLLFSSLHPPIYSRSIYPEMIESSNNHRWKHHKKITCIYIYFSSFLSFSVNVYSLYSFALSESVDVNHFYCG